MSKNRSRPTAESNYRRPSPGALTFTRIITLCGAAGAGAALFWVGLDLAGALAPATDQGPIFSWPLQAAVLAGALAVLILSAILLFRAAPLEPRPLPADKASPAPRVDPQARAATQAREKRLFIHLLKRLQREGRLMDFLAEDLDAYDDAQIGAAARSVHAGCRRVVEKLFAPKPVMTETEEARIILRQDYDPAAITLTGRVGDRPPFQGLVRHTGWRAARIEIPLLAEETDPAIIAPAEVEVVD